MNKSLAKLSTLILAFFLVACTPGGTESDTDTDASGTTDSESSNEEANLLANVDDLISIENAQDHITYLAGTEVGGRASGSLDNQLACQYVADHFEDYGLTPYSEETGYFQPYLQPYTRIFSEFFSFEVSNTAKTSSARYRYAYDFSF
ncbi:MAG: hypothetical protein EOM77_05055, partial [Bacteroidia bacterium]|nr:hypothetical protein [Bacteroidia bacterium]